MAIFNKKKTEKSEAKTEKQSAVKSAKTENKSMKDLYQAETVKKVVKKADGQKVEIKKNNQAYRILLRPLVTEKVSDLSGLNKYVFVVSDKANKIEVAKAIVEVYGVKPSKVNILNMEGKRVRRGRITGKRKDWKKAIITLPKGQSINVYEGV